ncbi:hypothetical protein D3C87_1640440 [compost metagenome]
MVGVVIKQIFQRVFADLGGALGCRLVGFALGFEQGRAATIQSVVMMLERQHFGGADRCGHREPLGGRRQALRRCRWIVKPDWDALALGSDAVTPEE